MIQFFKKVFNIREGEGLKLVLMFSYIFLIIASLVMLKPIRNSLFLIKFGIHQLPYVYILCAVVAVLFIHIYSKYSQKLRLNFLIYYTHIFFTVLIVLFWLLLHFKVQAGWFLYAFFVYVALFGVVSTSQFWLLANYVFDAREAKRLFSLIGAGGISGGIFGGYSDKIFAPLIGTDNLLLFCVVFWVICIYILIKVWKQSARYNYGESVKQQKRISERQKSTNPFKIILRYQYLTYIAILVAITALVSAIVDFQYAYIASDAIRDKDELTAFFGFWLSNLSILSLGIQFFFTARILRRFGVIASIFFLPLAILGGATAILIIPALWSGILIKVGEGAFKQSINKAGMELLYLPVPSIKKNQAKSFIDVSVDSLATGAAGLFLILFANQLGLSVQQLSILVFVLIGFWLYLILKVRKEYINSFRMAVEKRMINIEEQNINMNDASVLNYFINILEGNNKRQIQYALQLLTDVYNDTLQPVLKSLLKNESVDIRLSALQILANYKNVDLDDYITLLMDDPNYCVRAEAVKYVIKNSTEKKDLITNLLGQNNFQKKISILLGISLIFSENDELKNIINIKNVVDNLMLESAETELSEPEKIQIKLQLAQILGILKEPELNNFVLNYLYDEQTEVVKEAIKSAGKTQMPVFIDPLVKLSEKKEFRRNIREALVGYGENLLDHIEKYLQDSEISLRIRANIIRVLSMIGSQTVVDLLQKYMNVPEAHIRFKYISALNKLRAKFPDLSFDSQLVEEEILKEINCYKSFLNYHRIECDITTIENSSKQNILQARLLLIKALDEQLDKSLERIFRLLGLKYLPKDLYHAYLGIKSNQTMRRANAIELLDNILDQKHKEFLIPVLEDYSVTRIQRKSKTDRDLLLKMEQQNFFDILNGDNAWLKICVLHLISCLKCVFPGETLKKLSGDRNIHIREAALNVLSGVEE
jgi:AAA family ATP:ADP antiporter